MNSTPIPFLPYWKNETTGELSSAVLAYWNYIGDPASHREPTHEQILLIRHYCTIWADYPWQEGEIKECRSDRP